MNVRYVLGALLAVPLLPLMYYQGKRIRARVPKLPEATGPEGVCPSPSDHVLRLLCIGESTIAGVGVATHAEGFAGSLAREIAEGLNARVEWKVYAKSGFTARHVREEMVPAITEKEADLLVIGLGGNDAFKLTTPSRWRKEIRALVSDLRGRFGDVPVVFANMPPIKEFPAFTPLIRFTIGNLVELLGEELRELTGQLPHVYFSSQTINLTDWISRMETKAEPSDFFSDGVHPSGLTYRTWAKDLARFIKETNEISSRLRPPPA